MLQANDYFEHANSIYVVVSISPSSASIKSVRGKDRLSNGNGQITNISLNSDVRVLNRDEIDALSQADVDPTIRKRGRPKGSTNRPKMSDKQLLAERSDLIKKRGRPKGSTNKPKI